MIPILLMSLSLLVPLAPVGTGGQISGPDYASSSPRFEEKQVPAMYFSPLVSINQPHSYELALEDEYYYDSDDYFFTDENNQVIGIANQKNLLFDIMDASSSLSQYRGEGVSVAVIDTGIRYDHEAFTDGEGNCRLSTKSAYIEGHYDYQGMLQSLEFKTVEEAGTFDIIQEDTAVDGERHATSVVGTIFEALDGKKGSGLAPEVELIHIAVPSLDSYALGRAYEYLADIKPDIVNMSYGAFTKDYTIDGYTYGAIGEYWREYFEERLAVLAEHSLLFASSGNYSQDVAMYPAQSDYVVSVGALDLLSDDTLASYSNYGENQLVAPGSVFTAVSDYSSDGVLSSKEQYNVIHGTSFSSPVTAAAAALYMSKYPYASPEQTKKALFDSAKDLGNAQDFGNGLVDVASLMATEPDLSVSSSSFIDTFLTTTSSLCQDVLDGKSESFPKDAWNSLEAAYISLDPDTQAFIKSDSSCSDLRARYLYILNKYAYSDFMGLLSPSNSGFMLDQGLWFTFVAGLATAGVSGVVLVTIRATSRKKRREI